MKLAYSAGTVLSIPIRDGRFAAAQIVAVPLPRLTYMVFDHISAATDDIDPDEARDKAIRLQGVTLDSNLANKRWKSIGISEVSMAIPMPAYRVDWETPGNVVIEDFTGRLRRPAAKVAAHFGEPGGRTQVYLPASVQELIMGGFLR